jgi:hypothetical protein
VVDARAGRRVVARHRYLDARRAKTPTDGGSGAFGRSGPTAERSKMRQSGGPSASSLERLSASWSMKECTTPMTGKPGLAGVLAIGVRQHSLYECKTLLERRRHRMASAPAVSVTRPGGM